MWVGISLGFVYLLLIAAIFGLQRRLMYHPVKQIELPSVYGLATAEELFIPSTDGVQLQLWTHKAASGFPTIIYFHGNAFHLANRVQKFSAFIAAGFGLVAVSYRGFGKSSGRPSEKGIYQDARMTIDYAINHLKLPQHSLIYYGESLGTGVSVQMASERPPGLLTLEAAYTSVQTRSVELYPYVLGAKYLVRDKYDSLAKIASIHAPLLMLHGAKDPTIPIRHGQALFAAANEPKIMVIYPDVHHADFSVEQIIVPLFKAAKEAKLLR